MMLLGVAPFDGIQHFLEIEFLPPLVLGLEREGTTSASIDGADGKYLDPLDPSLGLGAQTIFRASGRGREQNQAAIPAAWWSHRHACSELTGR